MFFFRSLFAAISPMMAQDVLTVTVSEFFSNGYILITFIFIIMLVQYVMAEYHFFIMIREGMRMKAAVQVRLSKLRLIDTFLADPHPILLCAVSLSVVSSSL